MNQLAFPPDSLSSLGSILLTVYGMQLMCKRWPVLLLLKDTSQSGSARSKCLSFRSILRALVLLLCLFSGLKTVIRNEDWMSRESLLR